MKYSFGLDLVIALVLHATVGQCWCLGPAPVGVRTPDAQVAMKQVQQVNSTEQGFGPAVGARFGPATTATELLVLGLDFPDLEEATRIMEVGGARSMLWRVGSHLSGSRLLLVVQVGSAVSRIGQIEFVSL